MCVDLSQGYVLTLAEGRRKSKDGRAAEGKRRKIQALADYVVLFKRTSGAVKEARKGQEWLASLQEKLDRLRLACKNVRDIIEPLKQADEEELRQAGGVSAEATE